jgi:mRNA-degrading endonuclease RelE of RelBE toxin-antitoxin system
MVFVIKFTEHFEKKFLKIIPYALQEQAWTRIRQLSSNPFIGKPLRYDFIRELKLGKFRIYFVIFEEEVVVLLADISDKKHQQEVIDMIYSQRELLREYVKNLKESEL